MASYAIFRRQFLEKIGGWDAGTAEDLGITLLFYLVYLSMISERRRDDIKLAWLIPLVPFFTFALRLWNALATLKEMLTKSPV